MDDINYNLIYEEIVNKINDKDITKSLRKNCNLVKEWRKILRKYRIKLKLLEDLDAGGFAEFNTRTIGICLYDDDNVKINYQEFLCYLAHEFAHFLNWQNGKYLAYHLTTELTKPRIRDKKAMVNTAFRAEKYTDSVGKRLLKRLYPNIKYIGEYTEEDREWVIKGLKNDETN